uniref:F-box associated beta-propeller type 1 domain-containing protein n=3 Tax=Brassica oleracea var. oleracea TaxID=109376 RepID=A0A0D3CYT3_BRAOL
RYLGKKNYWVYIDKGNKEDIEENPNIPIAARVGRMMSDHGEKIVKKVPITSEEEAIGPQQQFVTMNGKVYSLRFQEDFVDVSVKEVDLLNELEVSKLYHCDGLVLCVGKDNSKLLLWNPYLCQTRLIGPRESFHVTDRHAIGYDERRNHKILRFVDNFIKNMNKIEVVYEIYEIRSDSWRVLEEVNPEGSIDTHQRGVSVKGNTYFVAYRNGLVQEVFLLCFDFTKERFGPRLHLPFDSFDGFNGDLVTLSSFLRGGDDEQLAVLFGGYESGFFEIWVTLTVDPNRASWSKFLRMEPGPFSSYGFKLYSSLSGGSFFVDEENKFAVLFELYGTDTAHAAFVFGQDGFFKSSVNLGQALILEHHHRKAARPPLVCSYRPSFVQVKHPLVHERKMKDLSLLHISKPMC